jgi:hypothetical protein
MEDGDMNCFLLSELSPDNLFVQGKRLGTNTLEARNNITVGRNVDEIPNRYTVGDVTIENNANVTFSIGANANFNIEDGFDTGQGNFEVITNNLILNGPKICDGEIISSFQRIKKNTLKDINPIQEIEINLDENLNPFNAQIYNIEQHTKPKESSIQAYPNPTKTFTIISFYIARQSEVTLSLYDITGNQILSFYKNELLESGKYDIKIDENTLSKGLYIYKLQVGDELYADKIIKE